jgi:hypothetical protein
MPTDRKYDLDIIDSLYPNCTKIIYGYSGLQNQNLLLIRKMVIVPVICESVTVASLTDGIVFTYGASECVLDCLFYPDTYRTRVMDVGHKDHYQ